MSLQKKFYFNFKSRENTAFVVEIWEESTPVITAVEVRGASSPFSVSFPSTDRFAPVRGSGCSVAMVSQTDRQFFPLCTPDAFKYQIRLYKSGTLTWQGYLDSELYSEPFDELTGYTVAFSGTDGLALLDRVQYLDALSERYTGVISQWDVIKNILLKLGLTWNGVYVALSTTSPEITIGAEETILHKTYVRNDNYYNEDADPETCRKVLEEMLRPYGATLTISNNKVYITDINTILTAGLVTFKVYSSTTFNYSASVPVDLNRGDLSDIGFAETGTALDIVSGVNKQIVKYSPYRQTDIIDFNASGDFSDSSTYGTTTIGVFPYRFKETWFTESKTWNRFGLGEFVDMVGIDTNTGEEDSYLKIVPTGLNGSNKGTTFFSCKQKLPDILKAPDDKYLIQINADLFARTLDGMNNVTPSGANMYYLLLYTRLSIGNKKWIVEGFDAEWVDLSDPREFRWPVCSSSGGLDNFSTIEDRWVPLNNSIGAQAIVKDAILPLFGFPGGEVVFEIRGFEVWGSDKGADPDNETIYSMVKDVRIKNVKLTVIDSKRNAIDTQDSEYVGYLNPLFKNEGEEITLLQGTNTADYPVERGALLRLDTGVYYNLKTWTKAGKTDNIEDLLLRSVVSNYKSISLQLTGTLNAITDIIGMFTYINYLEQTFMITECTHNFEDESTDVTLVEAAADDLDIIKNF